MAQNAGAKAQTKDSAESFVGSVFKFSISTYINFGISGLAILLGNFLVPDQTVFGDITLFTGTIALLMSTGILGLDQSLIRFFNEPPGGLTATGLFRVCLYLSGGVLVAGGAICSLLFPERLLNLFEFKGTSAEAIPLLFLGAFFYMVARYFNVLYRMEQNIRLYTVQSILMNFFLQLFYLLGAFFKNQTLAMMLCSVGGLGAFALVFGFWRRDALRPRRGEMKREVLGVILPYGLPLAPTAVLLQLNKVFSLVFISRSRVPGAHGVYSRALTLSNIVTTVQAGFASFWGAYMFANYKTQQQRIKKVHDFLNFIILVFFALLVAFEDVLFWILKSYADARPIFPLMMLGAVFTILCETTVYGIAIARRPIFDTIGIGLCLVVNMLLCIFLIPFFDLMGAAVALAVANGVMYIFRTLLGQRFYRTVRKPAKTAAALVLACALAVAGCVFEGAFLIKLACSAAAVLVYCLLYKEELARCVRLALSLVQGLLARVKT